MAFEILWGCNRYQSRLAIDWDCNHVLVNIGTRMNTSIEMLRNNISVIFLRSTSTDMSKLICGYTAEKRVIIGPIKYKAGSRHRMHG